ncbi:MAG TPA: hypothetical protein VFZ61_05195 [Polyangiales bacterium]
MSQLLRRRVQEIAVRVSLPPSAPQPAPEAFAQRCVSYVSQLAPDETPSEAARASWLSDSARKAYTAAGHKLSESVRPPCRQRV